MRYKCRLLKIYGVLIHFFWIENLTIFFASSVSQLSDLQQTPRIQRLKSKM